MNEDVGAFVLFLSVAIGILVQALNDANIWVGIAVGIAVWVIAITLIAVIATIVGSISNRRKRKGFRRW